GVEGLADKLTLAEQWGAREMFVPAENQVQAMQWLRERGKDLRVEPLMPVTRDPALRRILADYLARLGAEPPAEARLEQRRSHYASIARREAEDYYWRCLLDDAVARCADTLRQAVPGGRPTHLVTAVGTTASIVALSP